MHVINFSLETMFGKLHISNSNLSHKNLVWVLICHMLALSLLSTDVDAPHKPSILGKGQPFDQFWPHFEEAMTFRCHKLALVNIIENLKMVI